MLALTLSNHTLTLTLSNHTLTLTLSDHMLPLTLSAHTLMLTLSDHTHTLTLSDHTYTLTLSDHTLASTLSDHTLTLQLIDHTLTQSASLWSQMIYITEYRTVCCTEPFLQAATRSSRANGCNLHSMDSLVADLHAALARLPTPEYKESIEVEQSVASQLQKALVGPQPPPAAAVAPKTDHVPASRDHKPEDPVTLTTQAGQHVSQPGGTEASQGDNSMGLCVVPENRF
eukprot:scaffold44305_cov21-Tisochrysis_lutea.AAC.1